MSDNKIPGIRVEAPGRPALEDALGGCSASEPYALQVLGDSMEPEFPDRCVVIIEPGEQRIPGSYVFAEVEGVRWFRRYVVDSERVERLVALNDHYPEIDLTGLDWKVIGLITQRNVRRKVKHYEYR